MTLVLKLYRIRKSYSYVHEQGFVGRIVIRRGNRRAEIEKYLLFFRLRVYNAVEQQRTPRGAGIAQWLEHRTRD